ncbi:hypothetical protein GCM10010168_84030 [Actinoplanes ianthinogenes]|uniref:Uncharacterized protein n=1 Tax=Actinoplanes ianthinogenes TaxID=122358 RepID=A0ABN6CJH1_9ACTN|nr:hypothetical protein Aiant_56800 [Actinoplanes ianthinogenes]GGR52351.1 hypothetical protein GCM10010168_84030 [Actinoplanes ianthinogenes]
MQGLAGEAGEVERDVELLERGLDVRPQPHRAIGLGADERATPLPTDDQAIVAKDAERGLDGLAGYAVALGEVVLRRQALAESGPAKAPRRTLRRNETNRDAVLARHHRDVEQAVVGVPGTIAPRSTIATRREPAQRHPTRQIAGFDVGDRAAPKVPSQVSHRDRAVPRAHRNVGSGGRPQAKMVGRAGLEPATEGL